MTVSFFASAIVWLLGFVPFVSILEGAIFGRDSFWVIFVWDDELVEFDKTKLMVPFDNTLMDCG